MSNILIVKLGAAGDVVRTTPILSALADEQVHWITSPANAPLLVGAPVKVYTSAASLPEDIVYDLVLSLEEDFDQLRRIHSRVKSRQVIGAYPALDGKVRYTPELRAWYDMSLISDHGSDEANRLKLLNRRTYQDMLFAALGETFASQEYLVPVPSGGGFTGDIALADSAGARWPNKQWPHFTALADRLAPYGRVNILPRRPSVLEHLADIAGHRIVVSLDSLPLHLALGLKKTTFGIFNCTSPWEIHPYARLTRLVSPRLADFYYLTDSITEATEALSLDQVFDAVQLAMDGVAP